MQQDVSFSLIVMISVVVTGGLMAWAALVMRWVRRQPVLEFLPRRSVPWNVQAVLVVVALWFVFQLLASSLAQLPLAGEPADEQTTDQLVMNLIVMSAANLATVAFAVLLLARREGASRPDLGFPRPDEVLADLGVGAVGFLAICVPVYAVQSVLVQWQAYEHPIISLLINQTSGFYWTVATISAVVVAPLAEEFFFRLLLQGWLEKIFDHGRAPVEDAPAATESSLDPQDTEERPIPETGQDNPYAAPLASVSIDPLPADQPVIERGGGRGLVPIVLSSLAFGALHFNQWPAPIPLFVLALALGYIYRRTHRLLPCIALHALFNGCSLLLLKIAPPVGG